MPTNVYRKRLAEVARILKRSPRPAALLIASAPRVYMSHDQPFPYRENSDLFYLCGSVEQKRVLLIVPGKGRPIYFAPPKHKLDVLFHGKGEDSAALADSMGFDFVETANVKREILQRLKGINHLYVQNTPLSIGANIARTLFEEHVRWRRGLPDTFSHADVLLAPLRLRKSREEVRAIEKAIAITAAALRDLLPFIKPGISERSLAALLRFGFERQGAREAFESIVATGSSATIMHYRPTDRVLKKQEMLLLDCGARYQNYSADISRVYPVLGQFNEMQQRLVSLVRETQTLMIEALRPGLSPEDLLKLETHSLWRGLRKLKLVNLPYEKSLKEGELNQFFMPSFNHSIGLDIHDVGDQHENLRMLFEESMVYTVEPGLYFARKYGDIPRCGIRIEDVVLVTRKGARILSSAIPQP